jgi:hypothetical protein
VRGESGEELKVAADRVRFALPHVGIDALGVQAKLVRGEGGRRVREANAKQLEVVLSVGSRGTTVAASGVRREGDSGSALALLRGVSLPQLRESIRAVRTRVATLLAPDADISAEPVTLRVQRRKDALSIGPARAELGVDAKGGVNAVLRTSEGGPRAFQVAVRMPTDGSVDLDLVGAKTTLAELGIQDGAFGLQAVADARVAADLKLSWAAGSDELSGTGAVLLENAALAHQALSEHPLTGINLAWRGRWSLATDGSRAVLEGGVLEVGSVPINLDAKLVRSAAGVEGEFRVQVPLASCQALLDSAPRGLLPLLEGVRMAGTFRLDSQVDLVAAQPEKTRARWRMEQDCRPEVLPEAIDPQRFSAAWTREVLGADGRPMQITSGPGTPMWAPLESVTRHMETAVLVCEDGRFFRHRGFDDEAIANSLKQNLAIGKFVRGASTISMQLAKNLYLYREKTLSRKLQEAALTAVLERTLSKQQLMELYLNVIEFGPGIYGIAAAAAFYFDSTPAELSLAQSLYLASLLPKPRAHHFQTDGSLSPAWANYLRRLAHLAHKIKRIDDAELAEALAEEVRFRTRHVAAASAVEETEVEDPAWVGEPEPSL